MQTASQTEIGRYWKDTHGDEAAYRTKASEEACIDDVGHKDVDFCVSSETLFQYTWYEGQYRRHTDCLNPVRFVARNQHSEIATHKSATTPDPKLV